MRKKRIGILFAQPQPIGLFFIFRAVLLPAAGDNRKEQALRYTYPQPRKRAVRRHREMADKNYDCEAITIEQPFRPEMLAEGCPTVRALRGRTLSGRCR